MPAGGTLEATFGVRTLTTAIETFSEEPSQAIFQTLFKRGRQVIVEGRTWEVDEITRPRNLAPVVGEDSPFAKTAITDKVTRQFPIVDVKLSVDIPASKLFRERFAGGLKVNAPALVASELKSLQRRIATTIEYLCANALQGSIDLSQIEGSELKPTLSQTTSTGAQVAAWSTTTTKLVSDELPKAVADFVQKTGRQPKTVILNDVAERSLLKNVEIQAWAVYQGGGKALGSDSSSPQAFGGLGLQGFDWKKAIAVYTDKNAAQQRYWPDTKLCFLPGDAVLEDVLAFAQGYGAIPKNALGAAEDTLVDRAPNPGWYAFAEAISNPVGIRIYAGWAGLPALTFPKGVYIFTIS